MSLVLGAWLTTAFVCLGLGAWIRLLMGTRNAPVRDAIQTAFIGWAGLLGLLQLWHFVAPVNAGCFAVISVTGLLGLFSLLPWFNSALCGLKPRMIFWSVVFVALALWAANQAMAPLTLYDAGLYHLQSIRWAATFPVVPGLGNLHEPLAINSSYFLYLAWLQGAPWPWPAYQVGAGFPFMLLAAGIVVSLSRVVTRPSGLRLEDAINLLLLLQLPRFLDRHGTTSTDTPIIAMTLAVLLSLARIFDATEETERRAEVRWLILLASAGATIKLSFAATAATACLSALVWAWVTQRRGGMIWTARLKFFALAAALSATLLVPWLLRNRLLSGYLLFPSPSGACDVAWRIPAEKMANDVRWLKSWARWPNRQPEDVLGHWTWLKPWWARQTETAAARAGMLYPLAVGILVLGLWAGRGLSTPHYPWRYAGLAPPFLVGLASWFFLAPDPRFALALFTWLPAAFGAAFLLPCLIRMTQRSVRISLVAILIGLSVVLNWQNSLWIPVGRLPFGFHSIGRSAIHRVRSADGVLVWAPVRGDQVWDAPIPATPKPWYHFRLRRSGDLAAGFDSGSEK